MEKKDDALFFSGFKGCASSREYYWHLAADKESQWDRFPRAHSWEWVVNPASQCDDDLGPIDPEEIVKHLVEDGGWLLVGGMNLLRYSMLMAGFMCHFRLGDGEPLLFVVVPFVPACHRNAEVY